MKNIKIIIALHKKYQTPKDEMYLPLQVGAEGKEDIGFSKDNQISRDDNNIGSSLTVITEEIGRTGQIDINTPVVSVPIVGATTREQYNAAKDNIKKKAELSKLAKLEKEKDLEREEDSPEK